MRLHERRRVHRIAPDIESEATIADDSGYDWPGVNADPQFQRRQPQSLASRFHAGDSRLHFQRSEAGVDRMPGSGLEHAPDRHVGVADRFDLLQSMTGADVVERLEIRVKKSDERRGIDPF